MSDKPDLVNHPPHYGAVNGVEPLDVMEALDLPHHLSCVLKYVWRYRRKDGLQDLKKARFYLDRFIKLQEARGHVS